MKNFSSATLLAIFSVCLLFVSSCTDPLEVGSDLLEEDRAFVGFTDTIKLQAKTVKGDSISVFFNSSPLISDFTFGRMVDPYFGVTEGAIYLQPLLSRDLGGEYIKFEPKGNALIDSIVLILPIDSSAIFGDISGAFGMDVFEVLEPIDVEANEDGNKIFYSNVSFETSSMPLASTSFIPSFDSLFVKEITNSVDTADLILPHLRIPLDPILGQRFLDANLMNYENDSSFLESFKGLYIKPTGVSNGLLDLTLNTSWPGIHIYYKEGPDTLKYIMELGTIGRRISQYTHEYTGAVVDPFIEDTDLGDSLLFLQGLQGLLIEFEVPELSNLTNKVINHAVLEFNVATLDDFDLELFPPPAQIVALKRNDNGTLAFIDDVAVLPNDLGFYFGGQPAEQSDGSFTYTFNFSIHSQFLLDGTEPSKIYLALSPRAGNANQVILKGANTLNQSAILKITYTEI